jgi:hypothetical protein
MSTLREEIEKTVNWFAETDVQNNGVVSESTKEIAAIQNVTIDYTPEKLHQLWEQFKIFIRKEIGWYNTYNYRPMTPAEFIENHGAEMSDEFKEFMTTNVQLVNRQCDSYAIYFIGEKIPE